MAREKLNVRQQQFGFPDEDLKTTLHDEIVLWLKEKKLQLAKSITGWQEVWDAKWLEKQLAVLHKKIEERKARLTEAILRIERGLGSGNSEALLLSLKSELKSFESWKGPGDPGLREICVGSKMEVPIKRQRYKSVDIIGYADLVLSVETTSLFFHDLPYGDYHDPEPVMPDVDRYITWQKSWIKPREIAFDAKSSIPSLGELVRQFRTYREFCTWPFFIVSPDARFAEQISDEGFGFVSYPQGNIVFPRRR